MRNIGQNQFSDITKQLEKMSKKMEYTVSACKTIPVSDDEIYNKIMSSSFKRISSSKESATRFLKSVGIFDKKGHLAPEYK